MALGCVRRKSRARIRVNSVVWMNWSLHARGHPHLRMRCVVAKLVLTMALTWLRPVRRRLRAISRLAILLGKHLDVVLALMRVPQGMRGLLSRTRRRVARPGCIERMRGRVQRVARRTPIPVGVCVRRHVRVCVHGMVRVRVRVRLRDAHSPVHVRAVVLELTRWGVPVGCGVLGVVDGLRERRAHRHHRRHRGHTADTHWPAHAHAERWDPLRLHLHLRLALCLRLPVLFLLFLLRLAPLLPELFEF